MPEWNALLRPALRVPRRAPLVFCTIVITLAIAIGANTAIFSVVYAVLLRPLPFPTSDRLVMMWMNNQQQGYAQYYFSLPDYRDVKKSGGAIFDLVASHAFGIINLTGTARPQALTGAFVAPELLLALGAQASAGRMFGLEAATAGHDHAVVLSDELWRESFNADPRVIGRTVTLNREAYTVTGVAAPGFRYPINFDISGTISPQKISLWIPLNLQSGKIGTVDLSPRSMRGLQVLARLRSGVTVEAGRAFLRAMSANLARQFPESNKGWGMTVHPLAAQMTSGVRSALWMLMAAVGTVALMACANVASLLLAQSIDREAEMAVRTALGAGRMQIVSQLLLESLLYSGIGAVLGLPIAYAGIRSLWRFAPGSVPRLQQAGLDGHTALFIVAIALFVSLLFGLWPALLMCRRNLAEVMRKDGRAHSASSHATRNALVVFEFSLASVLLIASGLFLKSLLHLIDTSPGFQPGHVTAISYYLPTISYPDEARRSVFVKKLLDAIAARPSVESSGVVDWLPFSGDESRGGFEVKGEGRSRAAEKPQANYRAASAGYFRAMQIPLVSGRYFTERDELNSKPVVIINRTMAERYFGKINPLGRYINLEDEPVAPIWREIVGVVADVKQMGLPEPPFPDLYQPASQKAPDLFQLVVRSKLDASAVADLVRETSATVDPEQPVGSVSRLGDLIETSMAKERMYALLLSGFAAVAFVLAMVGICGVTLNSIAQRRTEIGIRLAIGAEPATLRTMILWHTARLALFGAGIGAIAGLLLTRGLGSLLYEVSTTDISIFFCAPMLLSLLGLGATYVAIYRTLAVDPLTVLRQT